MVRSLPVSAALLGLCLGGFLCVFMKPRQEEQEVVDEAAPCNPYAPAFWQELEKAPEQTENPLAELAAKYNSAPCLMTDVMEQFEADIFADMSSQKLMVLEEDFEM